MKIIRAGVLDIAYRDEGPAEGPPVILLHGFPYDVHAYAGVTERLTSQGWRCVVPFLRGYGATRFHSPDTPRSGEQAALGADLLALMDALSIERAVLGGYDWGGRAACVVTALWPGRVKGLVSCGAGYNIQDIAHAGIPAPPEEEARYWYQYYFHTERGRTALRESRRDLCRFIWRTWSPGWDFDDAVFERSAEAFDNSDFVDVVIHSYRHRYGIVPGDPAYAGLEQRLARQPDITVPAIVLQGDDDRVDPPGTVNPGLSRFSAGVDYRILPGIGHNLPQEAPAAFADAISSFF